MRALAWSALILIMFLILVFLMVGILYFHPYRDNAVTSETSASNLPPCNRVPLIDSIDGLSELPCCCNGSNLTGQRYYPPADMVISSVPVNSAVAVCVGYCSYGYDKQNETCIPGDFSGQEKFEVCMKNFSPEGICSGLIRPLGAIETQLFYPISVGKTSICNKTVPSASPFLLPKSCISTNNEICLR